MLAARTIKASTNSAGQEIYDEMTISYFEGTYDADWNVVGFEFYKNLVGKTSAQSTYDICYIDYTNICGNSGGEDTPTYTVTWKNYDDSVLKTDTVEYGTVPTYTGETPINKKEITAKQELAPGSHTITITVTNMSGLVEEQSFSAVL